MPFDLKTKKLIVIYGMTRGGTDILWSILGSHPDVCSTNEETGILLTNRRHGIKGKLLHKLYASPCAQHQPLVRPIYRKIDNLLYQNKLETLNSKYDKYKTEHEIYQPAEVEQSVLCIKSVNKEREFNPLLEKIYDQCYFVGLIRDGYALCEGWTRRGSEAKNIGKLYREFGQQLLQDRKRFKKHLIIKFEDALSDPFKMATKLFKFADLDPSEISALRLISKKIQSPQGEHQVAFGERAAKYWFTPSTIDTIIKPNISTIQSSLLSPKNKSEFETEAKPILEHFGYNAR